MQRYFLKNDQGYFDRDDAHHIINVMRMKTKDQVIVCHNNVCHIANLEIIEKQVYYHKETKLENRALKKVTLIQGLPKQTKIETTIKYATMFGVSEMIITEMKRSEMRLSYVENKVSRYEKIAKEASELAHRFNVPTISFKKSIEQIDYTLYDVIVLADELEKTSTITQILDEKMDEILVIIGPEGGIDSKERAYLLDKGAKPVTLGPLIFPSEIAHLYVLSQILEKSMNNF